MRTDLMRRLRSATDDELAALLRDREDLATPAPSSTGALAARALTAASLRRALAGLPAPQLRAAEALAIGRLEATPAALATALDLPAEEAADLLADLERRALVIDGVLVPGAADALLETPWHELTLGLGPPAAQVTEAAPVPTTAAAVAAALTDAPPNAAAMLAALARGPATGSHPEGDVPPAVAWLLEHRLLARISPTQVVLPREVGLAVRTPRIGPAAPAEPPRPPGERRTAALVTAEALEAAGAMLRLVAGLLELWGRAPATVLRAGGLGVRDLRGAAAALAADEGAPIEDVGPVALAAQLADGAGLLGIHAGLDADVWAPLPHADVWERSPRGEQWADLVRAWLTQTQVSWLVGSSGRTGGARGREDRERRPHGAVRAALTADVDRAWAPRLRRRVLAALAEWPRDEAPSPEVLSAHLAWASPRSAPPAATIAAVCEEARGLGLVAAGALSELGRAVLAGEDPAAAWEHLAPAPVEELVIQGDLTGIVPGPPSRALADLVASTAVIESHGHGLTVRFTPDSVGSAIERGLEAEELLSRLRAHSPTPLPQALEYLIADAARRHGSVRVGAAGAYVRADAPELAALVADPRLGLRSLAPTVAVSVLEPDTLLRLLRETGSPAVAESPSGEVLAVTGTRVRATRARPRAGRAAPVAVEQLIARLRAGDAREDEVLAGRGGSEGAGRSPGATGSADQLEVLRAAAARGRRVRIAVAAGDGRLDERSGRVLSVEQGRIRILDVDRDAEIVVAAHRVVRVDPL